MSKKNRLSDWLSVLGLALILVLLIFSYREKAFLQRAVHASWLYPKPHQVSIQKPRHCYAYSVVPCGVYTREEFERAKKDPVVARAYAPIEDVSVDGVLTAPMYVGFRKGSGLYWTRRKIWLVKEPVLLTIVNQPWNMPIRKRCGNPLTDRPQTNTLPEAEENRVIAAMETPDTPEESPILVWQPVPYPGGIELAGADLRPENYVAPLALMQAPVDTQAGAVAGGFMSPGVFGLLGAGVPVISRSTGGSSPGSPGNVTPVPIGTKPPVAVVAEPGPAGGLVLGFMVFGGLLLHQKRRVD